MKLTRLFEITYSDSPQVDRDAGVIRGVRILGRTSKNGREYSDAALRQAARLYEGLGVNLNHPAGSNPDGARAVEDGIGWLESIDVRADGVYGNLHYFRAHPSADVLVEAAVRNPRRFGLSHHADGSVVRQQGKLIVESIESVRSVDVVQNPATTQGLFEAENPTVHRTIQEIFEDAGGPLAALIASSPQLASSAESVTLSEEGDEDEPVPFALRSLLVHLLENDEFDERSRLEQAGRLLQAYTDPASQSSSKVDPPSLETLLERIERVELEGHCRTLLESAGRTCDPERIAELAAAADDDERTSLIESWPEREAARASRARRPAASRPLFEAQNELVRFPEDLKSFVAAIR